MDPTKFTSVYMKGGDSLTQNSGSGGSCGALTRLPLNHLYMVQMHIMDSRHQYSRMLTPNTGDPEC